MITDFDLATPLTRSARPARRGNVLTPLGWYSIAALMAVMAGSFLAIIF
jgi:hypothetical protein